MGFRGHSAAYGETQTGKTWLMTRTARQVAQIKATRLIVCSPVGGPSEWPSKAQFCIDVPGLERLLNDPANRRGGVFVFIDEAGELRRDLEGKKYAAAKGLFSRGRHWGMTAFLASQYPREVYPPWRRNATRRHVFRLGDYDSARLVCKDAGLPNLPDGRDASKVIPRLPKLHHIRMIGGDPVARLMSL